MIRNGCIAGLGAIANYHLCVCVCVHLPAGVPESRRSHQLHLITVIKKSSFTQRSHRRSASLFVISSMTLQWFMRALTSESLFFWGESFFSFLFSLWLLFALSILKLAITQNLPHPTRLIMSFLRESLPIWLKSWLRKPLWTCAIQRSTSYRRLIGSFFIYSSNKFCKTNIYPFVWPTDWVFTRFLNIVHF